MLAKKDQNIVRAVGLIGITLEKINDVKQHGWEELFEEVKELCVVHYINIPKYGGKIDNQGSFKGAWRAARNLLASFQK